MSLLIYKLIYKCVIISEDIYIYIDSSITKYNKLIVHIWLKQKHIFYTI